MSTERIDHAEKARELAEVVVTGDDQIAVILQCLANSTGAQVHATLALVEQQRIVNLIAYAADIDVIRAGNHDVNVTIREALGLS